MTRLAATATMKQSHELTIAPTLERQAKGDTIREEETAQAGVKRKRVETQIPLDRYVIRGQISRHQYDAGDKLRRTWLQAGGAARITAAYQTRMDGKKGDGMLRQIEAFEVVSKALGFVGKQLSPVLVTVCLEDKYAKEWALAEERSQDSGIVVLGLGLDRLVEWYGKHR